MTFVNRISHLLPVAALSFAAMQVYGDPTLTLSDSFGDSVTIDAVTGAVSTTGTVRVQGAQHVYTAPGDSIAAFDGSIGNWSMEVDVGSTTGGATFPTLDVNMAGISGSGTFTVDWTDDTLNLQAGESVTLGLYSAFQTATLAANEAGLPLGSSLSTVDSRSASETLVMPTSGSVLSDQVTIDGNGAPISTDGFLSVPDGCYTAVLFGLMAFAVGFAFVEAKPGRP